MGVLSMATDLGMFLVILRPSRGGDKVSFIGPCKPIDVWIKPRYTSIDDPILSLESIEYTRTLQGL